MESATMRLELEQVEEWRARSEIVVHDENEKGLRPENFHTDQILISDFHLIWS